MAALDYMMKLRGDKKQADTEQFHALNATGTSVLVTSLTQTLTQDEIDLYSQEDGAWDGLKEGVVSQAWLDTYCNSTSQSNYATCCAVEAQLTAFNTLDPTIAASGAAVSMVFDSGSGFHGPHLLWHLRRSQ